MTNLQAASWAVTARRFPRAGSTVTAGSVALLEHTVHSVTLPTLLKSNRADKEEILYYLSCFIIK